MPDFNEALSKKIRKASEDSVAEFLDGMDELIKTNLKGAVASILGFNNRYGGEWQIDHCNGRHSTISDFISQKADELAKQAIGEILTPEVIAKCIEERRQAVIKDFGEQLRYKTRDLISNMVDESVKKFCEKFVIDIDIALEKISTDIDIADPCVDTKFQEVLLKEFAAKHGKGKDDD